MNHVAVRLVAARDTSTRHQPSQLNMLTSDISSAPSVRAMADDSDTIDLTWIEPPCKMASPTLRTPLKRFPSPGDDWMYESGSEMLPLAPPSPPRTIKRSVDHPPGTANSDKSGRANAYGVASARYPTLLVTPSQSHGKTDATTGRRNISSSIHSPSATSRTKFYLPGQRDNGPADRDSRNLSADEGHRLFVPETNRKRKRSDTTGWSHRHIDTMETPSRVISTSRKRDRTIDAPAPLADDDAPNATVAEMINSVASAFNKSFEDFANQIIPRLRTQAEQINALQAEIVALRANQKDIVKQTNARFIELMQDNQEQRWDREEEADPNRTIRAGGPYGGPGPSATLRPESIFRGLFQPGDGSAL